MKVKIKKATLETYWYADKIGEIFEVKDAVHERSLGQKWEVVGKYGYCIDKEDCEETI